MFVSPVNCADHPLLKDWVKGDTKQTNDHQSEGSDNAYEEQFGN